MKTLKIELRKGYFLVLLSGMLLLTWLAAHRLIMGGDSSIGFIDPNIWLLILLCLITFLGITGLCWWLLQRFWLMMQLPAVSHLVLQFKILESWQQLSFFWASFALLLLTALGIFSAVI